MALTPEEYSVFVSDAEQEETATIEPSKTWRIDFDKNVIGGFIDDREAKKQFIHKALITERNLYPIYTDAYGDELFDLIGEDMGEAYLSVEVPRMCKEALIYDDRIESVDVTYYRDNDKLYVTLNVLLHDGETIAVEEVEINGL